MRSSICKCDKYFSNSTSLIYFDITLAIQLLRFVERDADNGIVDTQHSSIHLECKAFRRTIFLLLDYLPLSELFLNRISAMQSATWKTLLKDIGFVLNAVKRR